MPDDQKMSVSAFAQALKQRAPELAPFDDAELVRKVLERRPELADRLETAVPRPPLITPRPAMDRVIDRFEQNVWHAPAEMLQQFPGAISSALDNIQRSFSAPGKRGGGLGAVPRETLSAVTAPHRAAYEQVKGLLGQYKDPANLLGDIATVALPGLEMGGARPRPQLTPAEVKAVPGSIWGAATRARQAFDKVESVAGDLPVSHDNAMVYAQKAAELAKQGFNMPKPMSDFVNWVETKSKPSLQDVTGEPRAKLDMPGSMMPLDLKAARNFYTALGEYIPWDEFGGKGGKMYHLAKQMRYALGRDIEASLEPVGLKPLYQSALADWTKVENWRSKGYGVGYLAGKLLTYGSGIPHPWVFGSAGAKVGGETVGSMVKSIVEAEPAIEMVRRGAPAASPVLTEALRAQLPSLEMKLSQATKAGDFQQMASIRNQIDLVKQRLGMKTAPPTVGTAAGAASDTAFFRQAKEELGAGATVSQIAQRAQELKLKAGGK